MLLPFQGAMIHTIDPGRCPGLGAFGLSARFNYIGYFNLKMLSELAGISTSAPFLLVVMKLSTG